MLHTKMVAPPLFVFKLCHFNYFFLPGLVCAISKERFGIS